MAPSLTSRFQSDRPLCHTMEKLMTRSAVLTEPAGTTAGHRDYCHNTYIAVAPRRWNWSSGNSYFNSEMLLCNLIFFLPVIGHWLQAHCKRCTSYGNSVSLSVCPSVCPSHAGIVSKRRHVARCSLHCRIVIFVSSFVQTKNISQGRPLPPENDLRPPEGSEFCLVAPQPQETEKEVQLHLTRTRHGLSNEPSTKVLRRP